MSHIRVKGWDCVESISVQDEFLPLVTDGFNIDEMWFEITCAEEWYQFRFMHQWPGAQTPTSMETFGSYMNKSAVPDHIDCHAIPQFLYTKGLLSILASEYIESKRSAILSI